MAKYKATAKGFDGEQIRLPGEVFDFEGKPGKWMVLVEQGKKVNGKGTKEGPSVKSEPAPGPVSKADSEVI